MSTCYLNEVETILGDVFGRYSQKWQPSDPLLKLVRIVLGQRTTHVHVDRAMENLADHCADWGEVARLDFDVLTDLIRPAGLAKPKAARLQGLLEQIFRDTGTYSLDFLTNMGTPDATRYLRGLPGVGAHSAALVLLFALGRPGVMPVESHVHRVVRRLGWTEADASPHVVQQTVEAAAAGRNLMDLHVNLVELGHRHCWPGKTDCPNCPVSEYCRYARLHPWG